MTPTAPSLHPALDALPSTVKQRLNALCDALDKALGDQLVAVIVFGSVTRGGWRAGRSDVDVVVVLRDDAREVLARISHPLLVARYAARIEAILLRASEVARASDVFPLLYDEIRRDGVVVRGESPFATLHISDKHRRLRIEQELREARIRMRRMVTDSDGTAASLAQIVDRKLRQVRSPLRALLSLDGQDPGANLDEVVRAAGARFGVDVSALARVAQDGAAAYDTLTRVIDAAIEDVDQRGD
jgi:predicted nucleotidyltransferase